MVATGTTAAAEAVEVILRSARPAEVGAAAVRFAPSAAVVTHRLDHSALVAAITRRRAPLARVAAAMIHRLARTASEVIVVPRREYSAAIVAGRSARSTAASHPSDRPTTAAPPEACRDSLAVAHRTIHRILSEVSNRMITEAARSEATLATGRHRLPSNSAAAVQMSTPRG